VACHADAGIHSLASRLRIVRPNGRPSELEGTREYGPMYWETVNTLEWEQERYSWGLLNGYWLASGK
jgi:hypothetical protein